MKYCCIFLLTILFAGISFKVSAVKAYPYPVEFKQPNGEIITIRMHGDERFHYVTIDGQQLIVLDVDGYFTYARIDNGKLVPGNIRVSAHNLRISGTEFLRSDSKEFIEQVKQPALARVFEQKTAIVTAPKLRMTSDVIGTKKGLVILANFTDRKFIDSNPGTSFNNMLNQVGYSTNGATGSARDFYIDNSGKQFTPEFDVYGPVELPNTMKFYGENDPNTGNDKNPEQMIVDACLAANTKYPALNFADYDSDGDKVLDYVFVFYAGYNEAESGGTLPDVIWPHQYSVAYKNVFVDGVKLSNYACTSELRGATGSNMAGIGTFTHEFGHVLGLPDFYDTNGGDNGEGPGVGYWSTMNNGAYLNSGRTPPYFGAAERSLLGWAEPELLKATTEESTKTLPPISNTNNSFFRLNTSTPGEYFLFETRRKLGWDAYLLGEGMLVFHVDQTTTRDKTVKINGVNYTFSALEWWDIGMPNCIGNHQCYDLLRANNNPKSESGNPFSGTSQVTFISNQTTPGLLSWDKKLTNAIIKNITRDASTGVVSFVLANDPEVNDPGGVATENIKDVQFPLAYTQGKNVCFENIHENGEAEIYDITGRLMFWIPVSSGTIQYINKSGIYIVKLKINGQMFNYKLNIQ